MIFRFANTYLLNYTLLLLLAFLVRLPSFLGNYFAPDSEVYLAAAERMLAEDVPLYAGAWTNKPPLLLWIYALLEGLFGNGAAFVANLLAAFITFLSAFLLNQVVVGYRFSQQFTLVPGVLFVLLASLPWHEQSLSAGLLMTLPAMGAALLLVRNFAESDPRRVRLFWVGLLCGLCIALRYQGVLHLGGMLLAYFLVGRVRLAGLMTLVGGVLVTLLVIGLILFYQGTLGAYVDLSLWYSLDYIGLPSPPGAPDNWANLLQVLRYLGPALVLGVLGFFGLRARFLQLAIRQRRVESVFSFWLLSSLLGAVVAWSFHHAYFLPLLAPLLFYTYYFLHWRLAGPARAAGLALLILYPLAASLTFPATWLPNAAGFLRQPLSYIVPAGTFERQHDRLYYAAQTRLLQADLAGRPDDMGIWVLGFEPELYRRLGHHCAMPYTHFTMAYYKMDWFYHNLRRRGSLISEPERLRYVYQKLQRNRPRYIIDARGLFPEMRRKLPLLLADYQRRRVGEYAVYELPRRQR